MWLGVHGTVLLDVGGYLVPPYDASRCFESQLVSLMIGAGDDPVSAATSVKVSGERFKAGFGQATWEVVPHLGAGASGTPDPG
jgi:hypothetical protein